MLVLSLEYFKATSASLGRRKGNFMNETIEIDIRKKHIRLN